MPNRREWLLAAAASAAGASLGVQAQSAATPGHPWLPQSRRVGQGTLRFLGLQVYDASLFALGGFEPAAFAGHPLVLELRYRRSFTGVAIAERSLKEMRRGGALDEAAAARWLEFMTRAFPDVQPGDTLAGLWQPDSGGSRFAANDRPAVELRDEAFGPRFFGIWLATHTSQPELREQLLGLRAPT